MYFIISWDITDNNLIGPFDTDADAFGHIDAIGDDSTELLDHYAVIGPLPVVQRVFHRGEATD